MSALAKGPLTVAEQLVRIESVRVEGRYRRDLGDIAALARSIEESGQLQPIVLTPDMRLVAGERRLAALRKLGRDVAYAVIRDNLADATAALLAERDENVCRKDMAPSELAALGAALEEIERPKAEARMVGALKQNRSVPGVGAGASNGETKEKVAEALGIGATTYQRVRDIHRAANDVDAPEPARIQAQAALEQMDQTGSVKPAYEKWRAGEDMTQRSTIAPKAGQRNRKPITESFDRAAGVTVKAVEALERLVHDDRFPRNAEQVGRMCRHDLLRAADLLATVIDRVPTSTKEATQ